MNEVIEMQQTEEGFTAVSLSDLAERQLEVVTTGAIVAGKKDVEKFKADAALAIANINQTLKTDSDFAAAKKDIKACTSVEKTLSLLFDKIVSGNAEIKELTETITTTKNEIAAVRLSLDKTIKRRDAEKKQEIIDAGIKKVRDRHATSPAAHGYTVNTQAIRDAIKNKSLYTVMEECVAVVADRQIKEIEEIEKRYSENIISIEISEKEYPVLYADRKTLALTSSDNVKSQIEAREARQKLADAEKKRVEEEKRIADEKKAAEIIVAEQKTEVADVVSHTSFSEPPSPGVSSISGGSSSFVAPPMPSFGAPPLPAKKTYVLRVVVLTDDIKGVTYAMSRNPAVQGVTVEP